MLSLALAAAVAVPGELRVVRAVELRSPNFVQSSSVRSLGSLQKKAGKLLLVLHPTVSEEAAVRKLRANGVTVERVGPALPHGFTTNQSVGKLGRLLSHYRNAWAQHLDAWGLGEDEGEGEQEIPGLNYLGALHQYRTQRAYPGDTLDATAWTQAQEHRDQMESASIGGSSMNDGPSGQWKFVGPTNLDTPYRTYWGLPPVSGRVNAVAVHPTNSNIVWAGGAGGGLMRSTDAGVNWTPVGQDWTTLQVSCIVFDPSNSNKIYVGLGDFEGFGIYGGGIKKSVDGGNTWTTIGQSTFANFAVSDILIDPNNPNNLVASSGRGGNYWSYLYRSTDGGTTWNATISQFSAWCDLAMSPDNGSGTRYYYAVGADYGGQVWRSADRGATWTNIRASLGLSANFHDSLSVACSPVSAERVYVMAPTDNKVLKSTDHGGTWTNITGNLPSGYNWTQGWYDFHLTCSSNGSNDVLYAGLIDVQVDNNADGTWATVGGPTYVGTAQLHNDQHCMAIDPSNPNVSYVGNDGGLYRVTYTPGTGALSYVRLNNKLGFTQFYSIGTHPTDRNRMLGGTQDNATPWSQGTLLNWDNVGGGDGVGVALAPNAPGTMGAASQYYGQSGSTIGIYRTTNSWSTTSFVSTSAASGDRILFIPPMSADANGRIWIGTNYAYRYNTSSWSNRLGGVSLTAGSVSAIGNALSSATTAYYGGDAGEIWITINDGANWTSIGAGVPDRYVTSFSVDRTNALDVLVTLSGTGGGHVYRCTNPTAGTPTWTNVSGSGITGLPDIPVNGIARDPDSPATTWYAATDVGVFMTTNGGSTWTNATAPLGLPNVQCNAITVEPGTRLITVATYGRGMWQIGLPTSFAPTGGTITTGEDFENGFDGLLLSDNIRWSFFNDPITMGASAEVTGTSPIKSVSRVAVDVELSADRQGLAWTLEFFRFSDLTWTNVASGTAPIIDTLVSGFVQPNTGIADLWVNQTNGQVKCRVKFNPINDEDPAVDGWLHKLDYLRWTVEP